MTGRKLLVILGTVVLAGCSSAAPTATPNQTTPGATPTVGPTAVDSSPTPEITPEVTPDPFADLPDPCVLVTKEEGEAAVGTSMDVSSDLFGRPDGTMGRSCYMDASSGPGALNLNIWKSGPDQFALYKQEQMQFGDVEDVAGVGDQAYRVGWTSLVVLSGDIALEYGIEMVEYDPDIAQENLKTLALTSIGRL